MEVSGEVADLVVKESIQAVEAAAKLTGKGVINLTAFLAALAKENYKVVGKANIQRIIKEGVPSVVIQVKREDIKQFAHAKKFGILYSTAVKRGEDRPVIDVISNQNYAAQINAVMESLGYPIPEKPKQEDTDAKKARPLRLAPETAAKKNLITMLFYQKSEIKSRGGKNGVSEAKEKGL